MTIEPYRPLIRDMEAQAQANAAAFTAEVQRGNPMALRIPSDPNPMPRVRLFAWSRRRAT